MALASHSVTIVPAEHLISKGAICLAMLSKDAVCAHCVEITPEFRSNMIGARRSWNGCSQRPINYTLPGEKCSVLWMISKISAVHRLKLFQYEYHKDGVQLTCLLH